MYEPADKNISIGGDSSASCRAVQLEPVHFLRRKLG